MSEDKKPKIDLKARLGKKTVSTPAASPGGSIPPPAGIPKPSGIPAPPFQSATTSQRPAAPVMDATNPYGAMAPAAVAPVVAAPAAIRIEMSDDVMHAQQGRGKKVLVLAAVAALIGIGIGFALGGISERNKGTEAAMQGAKLELSLGFSHPVVIDPPAGITFAVPKQTEVKIQGIDKQLVGELAAKIRKIRPPEPYKGKGVKYAGEKVRRKEGKKK